MFGTKTQTPEEVDALFPSSYGENIGIVSGKGSNLVIVDLDEKADSTWARHFWATPFVVKTGKQGFHFYFRYPSDGADISCRTGLGGRKVDLRASGGYVVSPPSIHPDTKRAYRWMTPIEQLSLADMPEFDPDWLPKRQTAIARPARSIRRNTTARIERARTYLSRITCVSRQSAHNTLFRACCKLVDLFGLSEIEMRSLLAEWNQTNCFDETHTLYPWSEIELDHKITDSLKARNSQKNERNERHA